MQCLQVSLRRLAIQALTRKCLPKVAERKLFLWPQTRSYQEEGNGVFWLPGAQQIDPQQQVNEIVLGIELIGAAQQRERFGITAFPMEVKGSLNQRFQGLVSRRPGASLQDRNQSHQSEEKKPAPPPEHMHEFMPSAPAYDAYWTRSNQQPNL